MYSQDDVSATQHGPAFIPVMRPSKAEFSGPFVDYAAGVFRNCPDLPAFKVIPPSGWRARRTAFPDLRSVDIGTPIRQNVFGSKGAYRCILVEQNSISANEFKQMAEEEMRGNPASMRKAQSQDDSVVERAFWSGVTISPPLYGADLPASFFDAKLSYGWNLRDLGDLLRTKGAPKMWYVVSPKDQAKLDRLAQGMFPHLYNACHAFMRHKEILLSPSLLHRHGISYMKAKQEAGEFIVLNAAAYHCGFNTGFNCAEAVNFATPAWVPVGKVSDRCRCRSDGVRISMQLFDPSWEGSGDEESEEESEEEEEEAMPVPALTKDWKKNLKPIPPIKPICKPVKRMPTIHRSSTIIGLGSPAAGTRQAAGIRRASSVTLRTCRTPPHSYVIPKRSISARFVVQRDGGSSIKRPRRNQK